MGPMYNTKTPPDASSSKAAIAASINKPGSSEPDGGPLVPLAEIHAQLGKHLPPEEAKHGEHYPMGEDSDGE